MKRKHHVCLLSLLVMAVFLFFPCKAAAVPTLTPKYPSVVFEGAVKYAVFFTVTGDVLPAEDMGLLTYWSKPEPGTVENADRVICGVDYDAATGYYIAYTGDLPAKRLGEDLYFKLFARLEDGSYVYSKLLDYSILDYAHNAFTKEGQPEEFKTLMTELLDYATAAQMYFQCNTHAPANRILETGGHLYGDSWTVVEKPSLNKTGLEQKVCTICKGAALSREIPALRVTALTVTQPPAKTAYYTGEAFDPTGMKVMATLSDGSSAQITGYTWIQTPLTAEDAFVMIAYEGCQAAIPVTVSKYEKVNVSQLSQMADGTTLAVEGYFVGVAEEGPSADRELLLKDLSTDDLIAVRNVAYGSFPDYGYVSGDRICLLAQLQTDNTVNTPNKRYLSFSDENGEQQTTVVSTGNEIRYALDNVITVSSHEQLQSLFAVGNIPSYSYVRLEGPIYVNRYTGSDGVSVSRVHMNEAATNVSGIRCDGSRTVSFRDNVTAANLGANWNELFFETLPAEGQYPGTRLSGSVTAVYTGGNNYYFQLTVLEEDWVQLQEYDPVEALTETANAYFRQGTQIQYDQTNRRRNLNVTPEAATAGTTVYLDCSSYVNAVYRCAFGVNVMDSEEVPSTAKFAEYCALGETADVIGYWVNADYTTEAQIQSVLAQVRDQLQVGDVLVYRHGTEAEPAGHVLLYVGDDLFLHCTGSSYLYGATPAESRDRATVDEKTVGAIQQLTLADVFTHKTSCRYLFKATAEDTVTCFGLIRPMNRGLTLTQQAKDRLRFRGLDAELTVDAGQYAGVTVGETLTYTLALTNPSNQQLSEVPVCITVPAEVSLLSAEGMTLNGSALCWSGKVAANSAVTLSWSVRVDSGSRIATEGTVGSITLNTLINTVSAYTDTQLNEVAAKASALALSSFSDPLAMANEAYTAALGNTVFAGYTAKSVLDQLIDKTNDTCRTDEALSGLVVPNLYGGLDIKNGFITDLQRTRLVTEDDLEIGDVIVAEYDNIYEVFLYAGQGKLLKVSSTNGTCVAVTSTGAAWSGTNVFATFIAYDRFAVLRPSLLG